MFREDLSAAVSSPAKKGLQNINESYKILEEKYADILHSIVENNNMGRKMGKPSIEIDISFLCTRVIKRTKEKKSNLRQVLQYLKHTINDNMTMGTDSLSQLCKWVDTKYGVHTDLKILTGGCMPFECGIVHCKTNKQKLNTKSYTEAKLVCVSDYLPYNICICFFGITRV